MRKLDICGFGIPRVSAEDLGELRFQTDKSLELLVVAALSPDKQLTRSSAAASMRMDVPESQARKALSTDLWRMRKAFDSVGLDSSDYVQSDPRGIGLNPEAPIRLDLLDFERSYDCLGAIPAFDLNQDQADKLKSLTELWRDEILVGFDYEWCFVLRERLRSKYTALVDQLLHFALERDNWSEAVVWAKRLLELDPLMEHAHRALMQCHFLTGNRAMAIRQYGDCKAILARELAVEPSEETTRMYRGLLSVQVTPPSENKQPQPVKINTVPDTIPGHRKSLTDQLSMALGNLNQARSLVENVDTALRNKR